MCSCTHERVQPPLSAGNIVCVVAAVYGTMAGHFSITPDIAVLNDSSNSWQSWRYGGSTNGLQSVVQLGKSDKTYNAQSHCLTYMFTELHEMYHPQQLSDPFTR